MIQHHVKGAILFIKDAFGEEPEQQLVDEAISITEGMKQQAGGKLFLYGWELKQQLILLVEKAKGIGWEQSILNLPPDKPKRKSRKRLKAEREAAKEQTIMEQIQKLQQSLGIDITSTHDGAEQTKV